MDLDIIITLIGLAVTIIGSVCFGIGAVKDELPPRAIGYILVFAGVGCILYLLGGM